MPQDFSTLTDAQLLALARRAGVLEPEVSTFDKVLGATEKVSGLASLGSLVGFIPHPAAKVVGAGLGALGSAGFIGAGTARLAKGDLLQGGLELGGGLLGSGGLSKGISKGVGVLNRAGRRVLPAATPAAKVITPKVLPPTLAEALGKKAVAPIPTPVPAPTTGITLEQELIRRGVRKPTPTVTVPPPVRTHPLEMEIPVPPKAQLNAPPGTKFTMSRDEKLLAKHGRTRAQSAGQLGTPAVEHAIDRIGTEYERTKESLRALKTMTGGTAAGEFTKAELEHARTYSGMALNKARQLAAKGKVTNEKELNTALQAALKNAGYMSTELATRIALASAGAVGGAAVGDTPRERLGFGAAGAMAGFAAPGVMKGLAHNRWATIEDLTYFSLLSSPVTMMKANLGAVGGAISKATEMIFEGTQAGNAVMVGNGAKILKSLLTESPKIYMKAFKDPVSIAAQVLGKVPGHVPARTMGGVGRILTAGDTAAIHAMRQGGVSIEEAARYTLAGNPTSTIGQWLVNLKKNAPGGLTKGAITQIMPFPRTGAQMIERGLMERTPLGLLQYASPTMKQQLGNTGASNASIAVKAGLGTAAAGLGALGEENVPTQLQPLLGAALGPYAVPYGLGFASKRALRGGKPFQSGVSTALEDVVPLSRNPAAMMTRFPQEIASRVVPGMVAHVAQAIDPAYSRQTGPAELVEEGYGNAESMLGAIMARIPGLRERLPEVNRPVDAFGKPRITERPFGKNTSIATQKFITSSASSGLPLPPAMSLSDPRLKLLAETGVKLGPRQGTFQIEGQDIPLTREQRLQVQRTRGIAVELAVDLISKDPTLSRMPPGPLKKMMIEQIIQEVQNELQDMVPAALLGGTNDTAR